MEYTFENIKEKGLLLYEYIRGSQSQGLALPTSDTDYGGVFCMTKEDQLGMTSYKVENIKDERGDTAWYEIGHFVELLYKANPDALAALFVPESCIIYMHPAFKVIYDMRQEFVVKACFKSFYSYGVSQIEKARGLKKKITNPVTELLSPIDFCHVPKGQGSQKVEKWLGDRGLNQKFCGLNRLAHMVMCCGVCYDYGTHLRCMYTDKTFNKLYHGKDKDFNLFMNFMIEHNVLSKKDRIRLFFSFNRYKTILKIVQPKGYHGIVKANGTSNEIRLDSLIKYDQPICYLQYNESGYKMHCTEYKETQEWIKNRNPERYKLNKDKEFDRKNIMHAYRLANMGIEIARTGQINVDRTNIDREFLLNIKLGNATYDELIAGLDAKKEVFKAACAESTIPDKLSISKDELNDILVDIRNTMTEVK